MSKLLSRIRNRGSSGGFSVVEMVIALGVLSVAMIGGLAMVTMGMQRNGSLRTDTTSANIAQTFLEDIASAKANAAPVVQIADCTGAIININTAGPAPGPGALGAVVYTPADLPLPPGFNVGDINFTQPAVANYQANYIMCAPGGAQITYDVRWRIDTTGFVDGKGVVWGKLVTVAAVQRGNITNNAHNRYSAPVTLRTVVGR